MPFEGIIFDVDGTLVDSNDAHARAFQAAFAERGIDLPLEKIRRLIGKGSDKLIPELIGRYDDALAERKKAIFKQQYLPALRPFDGVRALLQTVRTRGLRLAVASSASGDELGALLEVAQAQDCFEVKIDADDAERSKPDPDVVEAAVRKLRVPRGRCAMVGDTPYDAEAAGRTGIAFVGLRCGGWRDTELQPAIAVYDDPAHALRTLDAWLAVSTTRVTA